MQRIDAEPAERSYAERLSVLRQEQPKRDR
jgi:hypothetical protein